MNAVAARFSTYCLPSWCKGGKLFASAMEMAKDWKLF